MLNRLTLVIHWLGFLTGIVLIISVSFNESFGTMSFGGFSAFVFIMISGALIPWGLGWLVRFILVGK